MFYNITHKLFYRDRMSADVNYWRMSTITQEQFPFGGNCMVFTAIKHILIVVCSESVPYQAGRGIKVKVLLREINANITGKGKQAGGKRINVSYGGLKSCVWTANEKTH